MAAPQQKPAMSKGARSRDDGKPQKPSEYNGAVPVPLRKKHRAS